MMAISIVATLEEHQSIDQDYLGNGARVTSPDTVPFALWSAACHLSDYKETLWATLRGLGDRDTTCAMVGGIVVMAAGVENIPSEWLSLRESVPRHLLKSMPS